MKKCASFFVFFLLVALSGCATLGRKSGDMEYFRFLPGSEFITQSAGLVSVAMTNPVEGLWRRGLVFYGSSPVNIIPNSRTGGWMFSRPAVAEFRMGTAHGRNWHEEIFFPWPRNSAGIVWEQPERFWGSSVGQDNKIFFSTGDHDRAVSYYAQRPATGGQYMVGGVVNLPWVNPSGPSRLSLDLNFNPGAIIKEALGLIFQGGGK